MTLDSSDAYYDNEGRYVGGPGDCEHRTVGSHRAWCLTCHEWCYPAAMCAGCSGVPATVSVPEILAGVERLREARQVSHSTDTAHHAWHKRGAYPGDCFACCKERLADVAALVAEGHQRYAGHSFVEQLRTVIGEDE